MIMKHKIREHGRRKMGKMYIHKKILEVSRLTLMELNKYYKAPFYETRNSNPAIKGAISLNIWRRKKTTAKRFWNNIYESPYASQNQLPKNHKDHFFRQKPHTSVATKPTRPKKNVTYLFSPGLLLEKINAHEQFNRWISHNETNTWHIK